jgi:ABC-type polysaccharide/polyol phosphate export permease
LGAIVGVWQYRHALLNLVRRELTVRYKRSVLGFLWSLLNPVLVILTFLVAFKYILRVNEPNYSVKLFSTFLAWRFFNTAVLDGANTVSGRISLVKRVSFPRFILPASSLVANFVDFVLSLTILVVFFAAVRVTINWPYLALAMAALGIQVVFTWGLSLILAAFSVFYADVKYTVANLFQMWFFLSPVVYSASKVMHEQIPPIYKTIYLLNPMTPILVAYKSIIPQEEPWRVMPGYPYYTFLAISAGVALATAIVGQWIFKRMEGSFAKQG